LETGIDVRPRRALEAFCRWEHTCARLTRDMLEGDALGGAVADVCVRLQCVRLNCGVDGAARVLAGLTADA
jgi:hypothetical protein